MWRSSSKPAAPTQARLAQARPTQSQPNSFPYSLLQNSDEIRVVTLTKGKRSDPIKCHIAHVQLKRGRPSNYEALSYEWGSPLDEVDILLNGYKFTVRRNLYNALCHLRSPEHDRVFWIDQLCINQGNLPERGHQVRQMSQIYNSARGVVVWLGLSKSVAEQLRKIATSPAPEARGGVVSPDSMKELYSCTYWRRAWIWQELFFAPFFTVQCGYQTLPEAPLFENYRRTFENPNFIYAHDLPVAKNFPPVVLGLLSPRNTYDNSRGRFTFESLFLNALSNNVDCTEPRDLIYSLMAMVNEGRWTRIVPDYSKPLLELYEQTVLSCFDIWNPTPHEKLEFARRLAKRLGLRIDEKSIKKLIPSL